MIWVDTIQTTVDFEWDRTDASIDRAVAELKNKILETTGGEMPQFGVLPLPLNGLVTAKNEVRDGIPIRLLRVYDGPNHRFYDRIDAIYERVKP